MMHIKTKGLVLREINYKDADKILTVLTMDEGKITVTARGCRRKNSKNAAASQLFTYSEMSLFFNRGKFSLDEAATIQQFTGLRSDISSLSLAAYFSQLLELVSDEDSPDSRLLHLGLLALNVLSRARRPLALVKAAFELRLMCIAGYTPVLNACAVCGNPDPEEARFDLTGGSIRCRSCMGSGLPVFGGTLAAMRHITDCNAQKVFSFTLSEDSAKGLGNICEAYLLCQLERGFHTLDFYKSLKGLC